MMGKEEGTLSGKGLFCLLLLCDSKSALLSSEGQGAGLVEMPRSWGSSRIPLGLEAQIPRGLPSLSREVRISEYAVFEVQAFLCV